MLAASILDIYARRFDPRRLLDDSPSLLPADYRQRELVSTSSGYDLETDRKRDKWLNGKALNRTAREADQIHYCQLPKELAFQDRVPTKNISAQGAVTAQQTLPTQLKNLSRAI